MNNESKKYLLQRITDISLKHQSDLNLSYMEKLGKTSWDDIVKEWYTNLSIAKLVLVGKALVNLDRNPGQTIYNGIESIVKRALPEEYAQLKRNYEKSGNDLLAWKTFISYDIKKEENNLKDNIMFGNNEEILAQLKEFSEKKFF
jgi:hypothetical protein